MTHNEKNIDKSLQYAYDLSRSNGIKEERKRILALIEELEKDEHIGWTDDMILGYKVALIFIKECITKGE